MINVDSGVDVVPLVAGSTTEVHTHRVVSNSGNHRAFSIVESGNESKKSACSKAGNGSGNMSRVLKENTSRGFKVRKGSESHATNRFVLVEWIQFATNRLDSFCNTMGAASPGFHLHLKNVIRKYNPSFVVLLKTRVSGSVADFVIRKIGYANSSVLKHGGSMVVFGCFRGMRWC
ncbi:hypothetical protein V6N13_047035 [Hibiscus sabdariffa]